MCFLPVRCLKVIVFIGSICTIAASLVLLALVIYVQVEKKEIISKASQAATTGSLVALYLTTILFLLLGVAGLAGSVKNLAKEESRGACLLGLFSIGVLIFFLIFAASTIFFFVGPGAIFGKDCTQGSKTNLIHELYTTSSEAYRKFCQIDCPCKIDDKASELYRRVKFNKGVVSDTGAEKFGDCSTSTAIQSSTANIEIMATLENLLQCGGWCPISIDNPPFTSYTYRFRNINDCTSAECLAGLENCHDKFESFMMGSGRTVGLGCLVAALVCILNIVAICCICLHPTKANKGSNFYSRMIEID